MHLYLKFFWRFDQLVLHTLSHLLDRASQYLQILHILILKQYFYDLHALFKALGIRVHNRFFLTFLRQYCRFLNLIFYNVLFLLLQPLLINFLCFNRCHFTCRLLFWAPNRFFWRYFYLFILFCILFFLFFLLDIGKILRFVLLIHHHSIRFLGKRYFAVLILAR